MPDLGKRYNNKTMHRTCRRRGPYSRTSTWRRTGPSATTARRPVRWAVSLSSSVAMPV
jgi:hypothetical protein